MTGPNEDTYDVMRARTWDIIGPDGPSDSLDDLLGALGVYGYSPESQRKALQEWRRSTASLPAPATLKIKVDTFIQTGQKP
jgi:hypothetical protein